MPPTQACKQMVQEDGILSESIDQAGGFRIDD